MKLGLLATAAAALFTILLGWGAYGAGRRGLENAFDALGVQLARTLAATEVEGWSATHGTLLEAVERVAQDGAPYAAYLQERFGVSIDPGAARAARGEDGRKGSISKEVREQESAFRREFEREREVNLARLGGLLRFGSVEQSPPTDIVDAYLVHEGKATCVARALPDGAAFRVVRGREPFFVSDAGTDVATGGEILKGVFEGGGRARGYVYPVTDADGRITHRAYVFLATHRLERALSSLGTRILLLGVLAVLAVGVVTYVAARWMTLPILELSRELDAMTSGDLDHGIKVATATHDEIEVLARSTNALVRRLRETHPEPRNSNPETPPATWSHGI